MNVQVKWLEELTNLKLTPKELENKLTMSGTKVEKIHYNGENLKGIVIGKIEKINKHKDADKLLVCDVNIGNETLQIVTGATNIYENAIIPVAIDGAVLDDGTVIKKGTLRGVESNGMLCSIEELGHTRENFPEAPENGIYIFNGEQKLGEDAVETLGLRQTILELELTSNRPDCNSIFGIAREVCASYKTYFEEEALEEIKGIEEPLTKAFIETENCKRYMLLRLENANVSSSVKEVLEKLRLSGARGLNNIVDITNLVMLEYGQPLHAFDADKIKGNITVRQAKNGETIKALDGEVYELTEEIMVIADEEGPVAIAGIIGGFDSRVTEETKTIFLESANFDGANIRSSSKLLGIRTDASACYEKGLCPNMSEKSLKRAAKYLGLKCTETYVDVYPNKVEPFFEVKYNLDFINSLLGIKVTNSEVENILSLLNIEAKDAIAKISSFRSDIKGEADIAEEVIRIYGYENLEPTVDNVKSLAKFTKSQKLENTIKQFCVSKGLFEIVTSSFENEEVVKNLKITNDPIKILNPLAGNNVMKTESSTGMLNIMKINYSRRNLDVSLFEISKIYLKDGEGDNFKIREPKILTIGQYGENTDFFSVKGIVEELCEFLNISLSFKPCVIPFLHGGRRASIVSNGEELGYIGEVHPEILEQYEIGTRSYIATLNVDLMERLCTEEKTYKPLPKFPSIKRDLTMTIKKYIYSEIVEKTLLKYGTELLKEVSFLSVYTGESIRDSHKSITYSLTFRSDDRTLEDKEVNEIMEQIIKKCEEELIAIIKK